MQSVLTYIDFREYIRDFYNENKKTSRLSFREFSKRAGFTSPSFIKLVFEGKANLSSSSISGLCRAMNLKKAERKYFKNLVFFGQAKDIEAKMRCLEAIKSLRGSITVNALTNEQFDYFSQWYHPVIKELIDIIEFDGNYERLAKMVNPAITPMEARESVELLLRLQLIKEENGRFTATQKFLTADGLHAGNVAIQCLQKKMAYLAADAVDGFPKESRDISGVSVSISGQSLDKIRAELAGCRRRIFEIAAQDSKCDSVYRVNFHLFPISERAPESLLKKAERPDHE